MSTKFSKGQTVRLVTVVPEGPVAKLRMTEDGVVEYLVQWKDANGQEHERWFTEDALTAV